MATRATLEDLYRITDSTYTTGSESLDGILIGLATWLIIRNSEFIILDILTFLFGNRKHRTAYRVLRIWEVLNLFHFHTLITGFDSDIPQSYCRKGVCAAAPSRLITRKSKFKALLVLSVLLGKVLVLGTEVAIIAFVIPIPTVHRSEGGLGFRWTNTTVTEQSISNLPVCQHLITSNRLADIAQLVLCKRNVIPTVATPVPPKWIPNGSLRLEEVILTSDNIPRFGGNVAENDLVLCNGLQLGGDTDSISSNPGNSDRRPDLADEFSVQWQNTIDTGEIAVIGRNSKATKGGFMDGFAAILPLFSDTQVTLRLSFPEFWNVPTRGEKGITLNGKLLFGGPNETVVGSQTNTICPDAIDEVIRVTGTLQPGLLLDIIRSGFTVFGTDNFTQPSHDITSLQLVNGYEIGSSRKFRIQPEWMGVAAVLILLLSAITSRLNNTRSRMARVYREHNKMWSACSASFLEKEVVVEGALYQNEDQFHWGSDPGWPWYQVSFSEMHENATLI